jgi:hypothetical protein
MFKIQVLDTFINECRSNGKDINYQNFSVINESYSVNGESVSIPAEIFEAYMKYVDISGTEMVTINEFEKIKSFSEYIQSKEEGGEESEEEDDDDDDDDEPAAEEPAAEEPAAEEPAAEEPAAEEPAAEPAAEEPAAEEPAAEEPAASSPEDDEEESPEDALKIEGVQIQPEPVKTQKEEKSDDKRHQTAIAHVATDGKKTADAIEDTITRMGEPQKASSGVAGEEEGEILRDKTAKVKPLSENSLQDQGAKVKTQEGESDDPVNGTSVPEIDTDGQKTSDEIENKVMKMGEPEKASTGVAGEKKGESLLGESEKKSLITEDSDSFVINDIISEEASEIVESLFASLGYTSLNESWGNILKVIFTNPIKGLKIKNNLKQYAKYKLDSAAIDMDTVKKKQAALKGGETLTADDKEKLETAEKAKKQAVKDKITAVLDRINQLATTEPLQKFAALAKTKAELAAAQKLMKIAQGEEAEALKLKVDKYKEDITTYTDELENYAKAKEDEGGKSLSDDTPTGAGDKSLVDDDGKGKKQPKSEPKSEPKNEPKSEPKSEPKNEPAAEPKSEPKNEPAAEPESKEIEDVKAKIKEYKEAIDLLKNKPNSDKADSDKIDILTRSLEAQESKLEALRAGAKEGFQLDTNNPLIKEAMREANSLIGGGTGSPLDNINKVNNTRDILRKAGLI